MSRANRIPFNPADYFFYSHDRMMRSRSEGGNIAMMSMDLDGRIDPVHLKEALRLAYIAHPVLMAELRLSLFKGCPYWKLPNDVERRSVESCDAAFFYDDFRKSPNGLELADALFASRYGPNWRLKAGPQMHVEQYDLPGDQTRICIRWPHLLMDAEGAMWFLAELMRFGNDHRTGAPAHEGSNGLHHDAELIDPLAGRSFFSRVGMTIDGLRSLKAPKEHIATLFDDGKPPFRDQRIIHRAWSGERFQQFRNLAKQYAPDGPGPYAKYLAACTILALHRIFTGQGIQTDAYLITMPHSVSARATTGPATRPLQGNYLVSPTLRGARELVEDKSALATDIARQIEAYERADLPIKQWAISWAASFSRAGFYQMLMRLPLGLEALSSGFSYYREIRAPLDSLCGAKIRNLWGTGPLPTPPAWNPVFSVFGDTLNLGLTYARPAISDELAEQYVRAIENEMFDEMTDEAGRDQV